MVIEHMTYFRAPFYVCISSAAIYGDISALEARIPLFVCQFQKLRLKKLALNLDTADLKKIKDIGI